MSRLVSKEPFPRFLFNVAILNSVKDLYLEAINETVY